MRRLANRSSNKVQCVSTLSAATVCDAMRDGWKSFEVALGKAIAACVEKSGFGGERLPTISPIRGSNSRLARTSSNVELNRLRTIVRLWNILGTKPSVNGAIFSNF